MSGRGRNRGRGRGRATAPSSEGFWAKPDQHPAPQQRQRDPGSTANHASRLEEETKLVQVTL